jgi:hypothetical protein
MRTLDRRIKSTLTQHLQMPTTVHDWRIYGTLLSNAAVVDGSGRW